MRPNLKMKLGTLAIVLIAGSANAVDWTRTVDYATSESSSVPWGYAAGSTMEAFWLDTNTPIDPLTGEQLSPYSVPDRVVRGRSSINGELWSEWLLGNPLSVHTPQYRADAKGTLWAREFNFEITKPQIVRIPVDGAQILRMTAADLGFPALQVESVIPMNDASGALVVLRDPNQPGAATQVIRIDSNGRRLSSWQDSGCTRSALDDRHGGYYAICDIDHPSVSIRRVAANPADSWPVASAAVGWYLSGDSVTPSGGILLHAMPSDRNLYRVLDPSGNLKFEISADAADIAGNTFWFWRSSDRQLQHVDSDGVILASATVADVDGLWGHERGSVLIQSQDDRAYPDDPKRFDLYSPAGTLIRHFEGTRTVTRSRSLISFADHALIARIDGASTQAQVLDRDGARSSVPFLNAASNAEHPQVVRTDAATICMRDFDPAPLIPYATPTTQINCVDRLTGARRFTRSFIGEARLDGVGPNVFVTSSSGTEVFSPSGQPLATIETIGPNNRVFDVDAKLGVAAIVSDGATQRLKRYRSDGSLAFSVVSPDGSGQQNVFLASDGSTLVIGNRIRRYGVDGQLIGVEQGVVPPDGVRVIDADAGLDGVQILIQDGFANASSAREIDQLMGVRLLVLSSDLSQVRSSTMLGWSWVHHVAMWASNDGHPRVGLVNAAGLQVFQFDSRTGVLRDRRVLDAGSAEQMNSGVSVNSQDVFASDPLFSKRQNRYDVDGDGRIRLLAFDPALKRDVLRISNPVPTRFTGPIKQRAIAGSWFTPSASGQGLLMELLNDKVLFAAWHTYAPEGGNSLAKQQWFTVTGEVSNERGRITLPIYRNAQGRFDVVGATSPEAIGSAELVFTSCDHLEFWYRIGDDVGAFPMQRLTPRTQACDDGTQIVPGDDLAAGIDLSGAWFDPARSGQGFTFNTTGARFKSFLAGWFTYDTEAGVDDPEAQHWFTLQGATPDRFGQTVTANIHRTIGGSRAGAPTQNSHQVGQAMLTVHDCASATLEYAFDNSAIAGAFANRSRSIELKRLGACPTE